MAGTRPPALDTAGNPALTAGRPTKSDNAGLKRQAKAREGRHAAAYEAGKRGETPEFFADPTEEQAFQSGREEFNTPGSGGGPANGPAAPKAPKAGAGSRGGNPRPSQKPRGSASSSLFGGAGGRPGTEAAGVLLSLVGYAVGFNFLAGGMPQVRQWFAAKFLNKGAAKPTPGGSGGTPPMPNPPGTGNYDPRTGQWILPNPGGPWNQLPA